MKKEMPYRNLDHALKYFRIQVSQGILWAIENTRPMSSPGEIFDYLKERTRYKKDPSGMELFQRIDTLLTEDNWHGVTGSGDCDCFSIAALSMLLANKFTDVGIVLAGRSPLFPVHIWVYVKDQGNYYDFDLTCKKFNETRYYRYTQKIPYKLNQEEKKMILALAEGSSHRKRGTVWVNGYSRRFPMNEGGTKYINFPRAGVIVPETYYDNLSAGDFQRKMLSEGIDISEIETLSARRAERKATKPTHQEKKTDRKLNKAEVKAAKPRNVRKSTRVEGKAIKRAAAGQAKIDKANNPNRESFGTQFQKVGGTAIDFLKTTQQKQEVESPDAEYEEVINASQYEVEPELVYDPAQDQEQDQEQDMSEGDPYFLHKVIFGTLVGGAVAGVAVASMRK